MVTIELNDNDIEFLDDKTNDIKIARELAPFPELEIGERFNVHYEEDVDSITHVYAMSSIDDDFIYLKWIEQEDLQEGILTESPVVTLSDSDLMNPDTVNIKNNIEKAIEQEKEQEKLNKRLEIEAHLKEQNEHLLHDIAEAKKSARSSEDILDMLFNALVPRTGPAETAAGEIVRAQMRLLYRDYNDGDKFFEGYGLETCASSAAYLYNNGFKDTIQNILDSASLIDEDEYTELLSKLTTDVVNYVADNPSLLWTENVEDSLSHDSTIIEEQQPRYEFELYGSDDVDKLVENGVLTSWDLIHYVEGQLEYEPEYRDALVSRPWSHHDTSVTVENLTKDGYDKLKHSFEYDPDGWWTDLTSEYADDLSDEYDDDIDSEDDMIEEDRG